MRLFLLLAACTSTTPNDNPVLPTGDFLFVNIQLGGAFSLFTTLRRSSRMVSGGGWR